MPVEPAPAQAGFLTQQGHGDILIASFREQSAGGPGRGNPDADGEGPARASDSAGTVGAVPAGNGQPESKVIRRL